MKSFISDKKKFLKFSNLEEAGVFHFVSTKIGWGKNSKPRFTGDNPKVFQLYRDELSKALRINTNQLIFPRQKHGDNIELAHSPVNENNLRGIDALITNEPGLCICVQTADCVPILLFDSEYQVVAAIHAGWRGTVSKIAFKTVELMKEKFHIRPESLLAAIGPSASPSVYEVGEDVISKVKQNFSNYSGLLKMSSTKGKAYLNLWEANKMSLIEAGLCENNIGIMKQCSIINENLFFSARREGTNTGRIVSGIMIQNEKKLF